MASFSAIWDLEEDIGVPLFVRLPRRLQLTPAGQKLLAECRKLFACLERIKRSVRHTHGLYQAPLSIGIADGIAQPRLSGCLHHWRITAPEVPLEIAEMGPRELASALKAEEIDVGFSFGAPDDGTIAQAPAWRYGVVALLPRDHELAARSVIALLDLIAFPPLSCNEERLPGLLAQLQTIVRRYIKAPTLAGAASPLAGDVTRIAAGIGVGRADAGYTGAL